MKCVILAGGFGTRMSEETYLKPKPMVEIGGMPILWHIMKIYSTYGISDFVICCGYKGHVIKEFFSNYCLRRSNVTFDIGKNQMEIPEKSTESWKVTLVDTGLHTMTGGRLKRVKNYLEDDTFCFTYGDTLNNINIAKLMTFHRHKKTLATVTACIPPEKYGILKLRGDKVIDFSEKPERKDRWVNGGYFVLEPQIFDYIENDNTIWEQEPMKRLSKGNQLSAYKHTGFYQPVDTVNDKNILERLWQSKKIPWKVW